jgi:hypothetical protein
MQWPHQLAHQGIKFTMDLLLSSYLRWILTQVTWANIRKEPNGTVGNFYSKLKKKKGSAKAIVAASAKMLRIIYWVLKEHRPYQS